LLGGFFIDRIQQQKAESSLAHFTEPTLKTGQNRDDVGVLERPEVEALITAAIAMARAPLRATGRGNLIIRSVSAKQRPRQRPAVSVRRSRDV